MTKRKTTKPRPERFGVSGRTGREEVKASPSPVALRCLYHTRLVVTGSVTGKRYVFDPGQVGSVSHLDAPDLLAMTKKQAPGCCGAQANPPVLNYFEET